MKKIIITLPLLTVFCISIFSLIYLLQKKDPNKPPSALLNENVPIVKIPNLFDENKFLTNKDFKEKFILINFFASWCSPCKVEHPFFFTIKENQPSLLIIGINYKDSMSKALQYLKDDGNPYDYVGLDKKGLIGLEFGVFGLPETFLINKGGKIIYKHLGPLDISIIENEIYSLLK